MATINNIQLKRVLNYTGSFDDAITCIRTKLNPPLTEGEPIICSYTDENIKKYFLGVCTDATLQKIIVYPAYDNLNDFVNFIVKLIKQNGGINDTNISDESDISITKDPTTGNYTLKLKASVINADNINYTYTEGGQEITISQNEFNLNITSELNTLNDIVKWKKI